MNYNPFEFISRWLSTHKMTPSEKSHIKMTLLEYIAKHPATAPLISPYALRTLMVACASFIFVLGGSIGITRVSLTALPGNSLYPIKIWVEEFQGKNNKTPESLITFESDRIEKRFNEAAQLASNQSLTDDRAQMIQSGLEHSRERIRVATRKLQEYNPTLALGATTALETTFSSNAKILARVEQTTGVNIGTLVLASEVASQTIGIEKMSIEKDLAQLPDDITKIAAETKYEQLKKLYPEEPTASFSDNNIETKHVNDLEVHENMPINTLDVVTVESDQQKVLNIVPLDPVKEIMVRIKQRMDTGSYSEALILLEQAKQLLDTKNLTEKLETLYQVPEKTISPPPSKEADLEVKSIPESTEAF